MVSTKVGISSGTKTNSFMKSSRSNKLDPLTFPYIRPEDGVKSYLYSKKCNKKTVPHSLSLIDSSLPSLKLQKLYNTRLKEERNISLIEKRQINKRRRKKLDRQWSQLTLLETKLKRNFETFNYFITANHSKKKRLITNIKFQTNLITSREKQINELKIKYDKLNGIKCLMQQKIKEFSIYSDYLQKVCDITKGFQSLADSAQYHFKNETDIINKYENFLVSKKMIFARHEYYRMEIERIQNMYYKMIKEKYDNLQSLELFLATIITRFKLARQESARWEKQVYVILERSLCIKRDNADTQMDIQSLYRQFAERNNITHRLNVTDYKEQLDYIKSCLNKLDKVLNIIKPMERIV
nr:coiled-coil domain-containing protein 42 homolog [Onthophagus taurus]